MGVMHGSIGDPPGTVGSSATADQWCNCACQRCLAGDCCRFPPKGDEAQRWYTVPGTSTTSWLIAEIVCGAIDHDYAVLDPSRLFCRKCGTTKGV